jgi:hypothetical protein
LKHVATYITAVRTSANDEQGTVIQNALVENWIDEDAWLDKYDNFEIEELQAAEFTAKALELERRDEDDDVTLGDELPYGFHIEA